MKKILTFFSLFFFIVPAWADIIPERINNSTTIIEKGVGLGTVIAVVTSWSRNHSVVWAVFHGLCSWLYVVYFVITRDDK